MQLVYLRHGDDSKAVEFSYGYGLDFCNLSQKWSCRWETSGSCDQPIYIYMDSSHLGYVFDVNEMFRKKPNYRLKDV